MAYVPVPKDLSRVKSKLAFNLTKRQLICFSGGALVGVPFFFLLKKPLGSSTASVFMILVMLPFFLLALYEKNGQPMEKVVRNFIRVCFLRPRQRPYKTYNFYAALERQDHLDKEVHRIVYGKQKLVPPSVRKKRRSAGRTSSAKNQKKTVPRR